MTIPTPTSDVGHLPEPAGASALIDLGELQGLANAFFQALPGVDPHHAEPVALRAPVAASPGAPPSLTALPSSPVTPVPSGSIPTQAPQGHQDASGLHGIPSNFAPALPASAAPRTTSGSSFYFLDAAPAGNGPDPLDALASEAIAPNANDRVTAGSFGLPGQEGLTGLVGATRPDGFGSIFSVKPSFSFLDGNSLGYEPELSALGAGASGSLLDVHAIRRDFPILSERVNGKPLVWFDNAATTQKPQSVIDRISWFYAHENSNIHRAAHELAARSTDAYEGARQKVADFLGAKGPEEIVFVRGATEGINLLANTVGEKEVGEGDEIVVSILEHHANIVPWQQLAARKGARIKVIPVDEDGQLVTSELSKIIGPRTKIVSVTQVSNALGTVTPLPEVIAHAHAVGAKVIVDGAQSVSHMRTNVQALDADFLVFSGHKVFAPTGIGVVYGKKELLDQLPPWQGGGNMIADVTFEHTVYQGAPHRFEAGTGNIADAVGLGAAIDYVTKVGIEKIAAYEHFLLEYATERLRPIPGVRLVGTAKEKASVLSFVLAGYKTEEVGEALNREGVAVRSGHHCAQPILRRFGLEATVRPSLAFYNTCEEVDTFIRVIQGLSVRKA